MCYICQIFKKKILYKHKSSQCLVLANSYNVSVSPQLPPPTPLLLKPARSHFKDHLSVVPFIARSNIYIYILRKY